VWHQDLLLIVRWRAEASVCRRLAVCEEELPCLFRQLRDYIAEVAC